MGGEEHDVEPRAGDLETRDRVHFERDGLLVFTVQARRPPRKIGERGARFRDAEVDEVSATATWAQLERFMKKKRIRGANVWFVDERGDFELMTRPDRSRRQSPHARAKLVLAVAQAERRYGEDREQWPPLVQRQIERLAARR